MKNKLTDVTENFSVIQLMQIAIFFQIDAQETERDIAYIIFSKLTYLSNYSSNFNVNSDIDETKTVHNKEKRLRLTGQ